MSDVNIDFGLGPKITGNEYLTALQAFGAGKQARVNEVAQQRQEQVYQRKESARALIQQGAPLAQVQAADPESAYDYSTHLSALHKDDVKQQMQRAQTVGAVARAIRAIPAGDSRRAQLLQQAAPMLKGVGVTDDELGKIDINNDGQLDTTISANKAFVGQGETHIVGRALTDNEGQVLYRDPEPPQYIQRDPSKDLIQTPGGGGGQPAIPSTGGRGTNPGNIRDGRFAQSQPGYTGASGGFATFSDPTAGAAAQERLLSNNYIAKGFDTPDKIVRRYNPPSAPGNSEQIHQNYLQYIRQRTGLGPNDKVTPANLAQFAAAQRGFESGSSSPSTGPAGGPRVVAQGAPKQKDAPAGYRWKADGTQEVIPGGPADTASGKQGRAGAAQLRKEFDQLPEVKNFKLARTAYRQIDALTSNPKATAQDDIAAIFSFMKTLDPNSTVREGEFATAQNATGVPDRLKNMYNQAAQGTRLNPKQRAEMRNTAARVYAPIRDQYNATATNYQGYARDQGIDPLNVARRAIPNAPQSSNVIHYNAQGQRIK